MEFPLSQREWELYKELKNRFEKDSNQTFDSAMYHKYSEWLCLLKENGVIGEVRADNAYIYWIDDGFVIFDEWLKDQNKKAIKLSAREWKIAIVSATVGALIGLIPTVITFF